MFLFVLVIDHSSRTPSLIEDFKAERETVWHCVNFVDGKIFLENTQKIRL